MKTYGETILLIFFKTALVQLEKRSIKKTEAKVVFGGLELAKKRLLQQPEPGAEAPLRLSAPLRHQTACQAGQSRTSGRW
jgi:hypothetical protein